MKKLLSKYRETFTVLIGEIVVSLLIALVYLLIGRFDYTVALGATLGSAVIVLNIFVLSLAVNSQIDKFLKLRGSREMSDEEAEAFAAEHARSIQLAAKGSYIARTLMMVGALVLALVLGDCFNVIATVIPLLAYRPIIFAAELIRAKISSGNAEIIGEFTELSKDTSEGELADLTEDNESEVE